MDTSDAATGVKGLKSGADSPPSQDAKKQHAQTEPHANGQAGQQEQLVCGYRLHPAAAAFPRLVGDDLQRLVDDISRNGLRHPIQLHPDDGSVLDGGNRLAACDKAGVEPKFIHWQGKPGEEVAFVASENLARRHLTISQRAYIASELATMKQGRPGKSADVPVISQPAAARLLKVGQRSLGKAQKVRNAAPENIRGLVKSGELSLDAGVVAAEATPAEKQAIAVMPAQEAKTKAKSMAKERREKTVRARSAAVSAEPTMSKGSSDDDDHHENPRIGADAVAHALEQWRTNEDRIAPGVRESRRPIEADTPARQAFVSAIERLPLSDAGWACRVVSYVEQEARERAKAVPAEPAPSAQPQ